jgi:putative Holliday junction resolvase
MASNSAPNFYLLGLDFGEARIGVAIASSIARLPRPLEHLKNNPGIMQQIADLIEHENITKAIVGLPRNLDGQETAQSQKVREFAQELEKHLDCPVEFAEESLSTVRAEQDLRAGKAQGVSADSLAACYILEEFFNQTESLE